MTHYYIRRTPISDSFLIYTNFSGDSAYALSPWLMKDFPQSANLNVDEHHYNRKITRIRGIAERTIGILKMRFRILSESQRQLPDNPEEVASIFYACATLHNFMIFNRFNVMNGIDLNANGLQNGQFDEQLSPDSNAGIVRRNELVQFLHDQSAGQNQIN